MLQAALKAAAGRIARPPMLPSTKQPVLLRTSSTAGYGIGSSIRVFVAGIGERGRGTKQPVLLRTSSTAGHGIGSSIRVFVAGSGGHRTRQWTAVVQVEWVCRFGREPFDLWLETDIQMTYLLITHLDESAWFSQSEAERQQLMAEPMAYVERLKASGKFLDGAPLHPSSAGATVRTRDGKTLVTDGPFAETREQIGGYTLIDAKDQDEAIAIATGFLGPNSFGSIEVRAVAELPDGSGRSKR
jgi:hypothetical protein